MRGSPQKIPPLVARQSQLVSQAPTAKSKFAAQNCRTVGRLPSSIVWPRKFSISPLKFESATGTSQRCAVHSVFSTVMGATFKKMRPRTSKYLPLGQAQLLLRDTVSKAWAQATWKRRASAWEKFKTYADAAEPCECTLHRYLRRSKPEEERRAAVATRPTGIEFGPEERRDKMFPRDGYDGFTAPSRGPPSLGSSDSDEASEADPQEPIATSRGEDDAPSSRSVVARVEDGQSVGGHRCSTSRTVAQAVTESDPHRLARSDEDDQVRPFPSKPVRSSDRRAGSRDLLRTASHEEKGVRRGGDDVGARDAPPANGRPGPVVVQRSSRRHETASAVRGGRKDTASNDLSARKASV